MTGNATVILILVTIVWRSSERHFFSLPSSPHPGPLPKGAREKRRALSPLGKGEKNIPSPLRERVRVRGKGNPGKI
jgi:hypothetical protein